jgi:tetratricopeptide (TPR) repeat protein
MELVKGIPITKYCDQEHLSLKERLELFIPVCQAVQHAHQKGIIHRDLKPSNVIIALYDGRPVPKVIDFGVAKATGPKLTEQTMFTEVGRILGTLEYMAPEQAELNNLDIDTRADIYSLGVMLYELLTGSPPFTRQQLRSAAFDEMLRIIREVEPPKPSTKLSASNDLPSIAAKRKLEPKRLCKLVHGDLDWIVMKCLEKDRGRRYETANGLVMDVQCYLADEPVLASPPTVRYRVGKFVRKHRGPVLAAGIIGVLLVGGIFGTSLGFWRAERLRQIAEQREQEALHEKANAEASQKQAMDALRATTDDVVERLIGGKPMLGPAEKEFLENTLKRWQTFASEQGQGEQARAIRAEGTYRVANLRQNLGQHETALGGYQEANILFEKLAADFPTIPRYRHNLARSHNNLGNVLRDLGQRSQAEEAYRQALAIEEKLAAEFPAVSQYRDDLAKHLNNVGMMLARLDKGTEAETAYRKALAIHEKLAADFPDVPWYQQDLAKHHNNLGMLLAGLDKRAEAETAYRKALAIQEKLAADFPVVPEYRGDLARSYNDLGQRLANLGQRQKAEAAYRQALAIQQKLVAESPAVSQYRVDLAGSHNNLGVLLKDLGKRPEAEEAYRRALAIQEKLVAESPAVPKYRQELAISHSNLGKLLASLGKRPQAEEAYRQALAIQEKLVAEFPAVADYRIELGGNQCDFGSILGANKELERAIEWYGKAIATLDDALRQVRSDDRPRQYLRNAYWGRALAYYELMRHAEAAADWDKVAELSAEAERPQFRMNAAADHARAGQVDAAFLDAEELAKNANADTLYNAACVFALASAAPQSTPLSQATREKYAQRAVALLQQAVAKGWKNIEHMKKDDDLKSLRDREDFKKLLGELEKNSPFSKNIQPNPK